MRQTPTTIERTVAAWLLAIMTSACAARRVSPGAPASSPVHADACTIGSASAPGLDTVTVALAHAVDPLHAPVPRNESERLLFGQLYETLIGVDCMGRPYPELATSWRVDTSGRRWTFTLRDGARFWDGSPVTARDVAASWSALERRAAEAPDAPASAVAAAADSVLVDDERTLTVVLRQARRATVPLLFASPDLAVAKADTRAGWPQGSGRYRVEDRSTVPGQVGGAAVPGTIVLLAPLESRAPVLRFRVISQADARDALDGGVDVLMTSAPVVLSYAATRPDFTSVPLPWDYTYALLVPARVAVDGAGVADEVLRTGLARDAVRVEARGSIGPYWWAGDSEECRAAGAMQHICCSDNAGVVSGGGTMGAAGEAARAGVPRTPAREAGVAAAPSTMERLVYLRSDRVARDLADRLVALAALDDRDTGHAARLGAILPRTAADSSPLIAAGLPPDAFAAAIHDGRDAAYVLRLPRQVLAPCERVRALLAELGWLTAGTPGTGSVSDTQQMGVALSRLSGAVVPLVDTRARLIVRKGVSGAIIGWDGTPYFTGAAPSALPAASVRRP